MRCLELWAGRGQATKDEEGRRRGEETGGLIGVAPTSRQFSGGRGGIAVWRLLVEHALPSTQALIATAVFGLRQSELLGLVWDDVDFGEHVIHVRYQLGRKPRVRLPLKTNAGRRDVRAAPELIALLRRHKLASRFSQPDDFVFSTSNGLPLAQRNTARDFATAGDRAGLNPKDGEEGQAVSLHDLRHTHGSRLIALGFDVVTVQRQLGHASPAITLRLYAHEFEQVNGRDTFREKMAGSGLGAVLGGERS